MRGFRSSLAHWNSSQNCSRSSGRSERSMRAAIRWEPVSRAHVRRRNGRDRCAVTGGVCRGCCARGSRRSSARYRVRRRSPSTCGRVRPTATPGVRDRADRGARLDHSEPTAARHVQIGHDEVGPACGDHVDRALGVVGLADHLELVAEFAAQARPHQLVVVGENHPDRRGRVITRRLFVHVDHTRTSVPVPCALTTSVRPPMSRMRATIDSSTPCPARS